MAINSLRRSLLWAIVVLVISMTGCASFQGQKGAAPAVDIEGPVCTLIYKDKQDDIRAAKVPLDGVVHVGQLLEDQGLLRKRKRNKVTIYRKSDGAEPIRLEIELEGRKVREEFNYALFDGDQIVVAPDTSSAIDGLIGRLGPLARAGR